MGNSVEINTPQKSEAENHFSYKSLTKPCQFLLYGLVLVYNDRSKLNIQGWSSVLPIFRLFCNEPHYRQNAFLSLSLLQILSQCRQNLFQDVGTLHQEWMNKKNGSLCFYIDIFRDFLFHTTKLGCTNYLPSFSELTA